jgi:hypothetical protein
MVQRWRKPTNPISNTIGPTAEKLDLLISAPYADKLPLKVAEYIRQDTPFAILVPLPLLNEIDRVGKTKIDQAVRDKRLKTKLIVSSSLGQAWLINHPSCCLDSNQHAVFFTQCANNPELDQAATKIFSTWYSEAVQEVNSAVLQRVMPYSQDIDSLAVNAIDKLLKDGGQRKIKRKIKEPKITGTKPKPGSVLKTDVSKPNARDLRAARQQLPNKERTSDEPTTVPLPSPQAECTRTTTQRPHTISTTIPPKPVEQWPALQSLDDIPENMTRVPPEDIRKGLPQDLVVLRDHKGRQRILVPACQRRALTMIEHEAMIHQKGTRVHHELSRTYFWPHMASQIADMCKACSVCQKNQVRRQSISADFRQADIKDLPMPCQAYGIDFYGHEQGEILVAVDLCTREATLWFLTNRKQDNVDRALLTGLIFQKGVPLSFRNDEAPEFVQGVVAAMNRYLGIQQITT